ncbi:uncharacterized protein [Nicotiana sylvestris]|uniref:uncharacterized protein n=1 Tax=Nicotiana sylvestris TaxID=4096 RepID=UPI00388C770C
MCSLSYLQTEKRGIAHGVHQLASLVVRLLDSGDIEITLQDTTTSFLLTEVNECQYKDPVLVYYRDTTLQKETPFKITEDGVLTYQRRLCVPNIAGLRLQVLGETHYSRYSIHPGATKMYHDIREVYWWDRMKMDIAEFVAECPNYQQIKIEHQKPGLIAVFLGLKLGCSFLFLLTADLPFSSVFLCYHQISIQACYTV